QTGRIDHIKYDDPARTVTTYLNYVGDGTVQTVSQNVKTIQQYDPVGRLAQVTDPLNHLTVYTYDSAGHLLTVSRQVSDSYSAVTSYKYDAADNQGSVTVNIDGQSSTTLICYDE